MTVLKKMKTTELPKMISEQIEEKIFNGDLKEGEKLPSEQQLAEQAGVGRRAVREALKMLELKGLIEIRKGSGSFVVRKDLDHFMTTLTSNVNVYISNQTAQLKNVMELRKLIEDYAISCLAKSPNEETINILEESLIQQEDAYHNNDIKQYYKAHHRFHVSIIENLENPIITMVYKHILLLIEKQMLSVSSNPETMRSAIDEHRAMYNALKDHDTKRSKYALDTHLQIAMERFYNVTFS